jgi:hypothetical protein
MNSRIIPANRVLQPTRVDRATGRVLDGIRAGQQVATAEEAAKLTVIANTTETAMLAASHITALQSMLSARGGDPVTSERLDAIASAGIFGLTSVVLRVSQRFQ